MLQLAGVIEEPWSQPGKYVQFCEFFDQYRTGHEFPKDTLQIFRERTRELRDHVLAISNVVVATAFAVGAMPVRDNVRPTVIAIDEAARLAEPELWLTLAWCNPKATLLIGDHQQLRPLVFSRPRENPFAHQLQISLFTRLKLNGFMDIMFTEQHRMVGGLCRMVSSVFYESKLVTAAILEDTVEQTFGMVRRYNGQVFRKGQSLTFLDVSDAEDERDCRQGSRINPKFAAIVYALINDLLHSTQIAANQIAVLTPYRGQLHLYLNLFRSNDRFRGVRVHTIDSFQGCESPVVIFDTTATSRLQFLADPNRLNVGVSRARSGMYIIGDWKQLAQPKTRCASEKHHIAAISRLMAHLRSKGCRTPIPQAWVPVISEVMHAEIWVPTNGAEDASW
jgi:regulator of nonsense transcripts 1